MHLQFCVVILLISTNDGMIPHTYSTELKRRFIHLHNFFVCFIGLQFLYFLSQTIAAPYITYMLSNLAPKGSAAPILQSEITSDPAAIEVIKRDPRTYVHPLI
jgi:hypothetical protein